MIKVEKLVNELCISTRCLKYLFDKECSCVKGAGFRTGYTGSWTWIPFSNATKLRSNELIKYFIGFLEIKSFSWSAVE